MKTFLAVLAVVTGSVVSLTITQNDESVERLRTKIESLEQRIKKLENIIYSTSQLSSMEAERRLNNARTTLEHSRQLRKKGYINDAQFKNDQFAVQQAEQELKLAKAADSSAKQGAELDVINAEQALTLAQRELEYIEKLESRGFSTQFDVQRCERKVRVKQRALELAKQKFAAFDSTDR